jgi:hypothetical protein
MSNKALDARIRKLAVRKGYRVVKSRRRHSVDNWGEFMLVDADTSIVVLGVRFDASLEEIETFFLDDDDEPAAELTKGETDGQRRAE